MRQEAETEVPVNTPFTRGLVPARVGCVVAKDVDPYAIVAGNPAVVIGARSRGLAYELKCRPFLG